MNKRITAALALLKPVDDVERERFTDEIEDALSTIDQKRTAPHVRPDGVERKRLDSISQRVGEG